MRVTLALFAVIAIAALHIALATTLPWPFSTLNITAIALVYLLVTKHASLALATTFTMGMVMELYALTPFGVLITALVVALIAGNGVASYLITTISPLGMVALVFIMVATYRITFLMIVGMTALSGRPIAVSIPQALEMVLSECIITTAFAALIIGSDTFFRRKSRARLVTRSL